jgi:lysophospholipid acyltransferase (LPLAT)-like uncharacterized protein
MSSDNPQKDKMKAKTWTKTKMIKPFASIISISMLGFILLQKDERFSFGES